MNKTRGDRSVHGCYLLRQGVIIDFIKNKIGHSIFYAFAHLKRHYNSPACAVSCFNSVNKNNSPACAVSCRRVLNVVKALSRTSVRGATFILYTDKNPINGQ